MWFVLCSLSIFFNFTDDGEICTMITFTVWELWLKCTDVGKTQNSKHDTLDVLVRSGVGDGRDVPGCLSAI